jgi:hypothetical protein
MKHFKGGTSYNSLGTYSRLMSDEIRLNLKWTTAASLPQLPVCYSLILPSFGAIKSDY